MCSGGVAQVAGIEGCQQMCETRPGCSGILYDAPSSQCQMMLDDAATPKQCASDGISWTGVAKYFQLRQSGSTGAADRCEDEDAECEAWAAAGECVSNTEYMLHRCRDSCCRVASRCTRTRCEDETGASPAEFEQLKTPNFCDSMGKEGGPSCAAAGGAALMRCPASCCGSCRTAIAQRRP